jgi:hypothetical protein
VVVYLRHSVVQPEVFGTTVAWNCGRGCCEFSSHAAAAAVRSRVSANKVGGCFERFYEAFSGLDGVLRSGGKDFHFRANAKDIVRPSSRLLPRREWSLRRDDAWSINMK